MPTNTDTVIELLSADLQAVDEEISKHKQKLAELTARRKQIASSLAPLTKESNGPGKPAPRKVDVVAAVAAVLREKSPINRDELETAATERIRTTHSLAGFTLRFREALAMESFAEDERGVRLIEPESKHE